MTERRRLSLYLAVIMSAGVLSRVFHTGSILSDKYLGDALYAAMVYVLLRLCFKSVSSARTLVRAGLIMGAIEVFQLTLVPAQLRQSAHSSLRLLSIVLGTAFSLWDLLAYAIGLATIYSLDRAARTTPKPKPHGQAE